MKWILSGMMFSVLTLSTNASAADAMYTRCDGCSSASKRSAAIAAAGGRNSTINVLDAETSSVSSFSVEYERGNPALAIAVPTAPDVADAVRKAFSMLNSLNKMTGMDANTVAAGFFYSASDMIGLANRRTAANLIGDELVRTNAQTIASQTAVQVIRQELSDLVHGVVRLNFPDESSYLFEILSVDVDVDDLHVEIRMKPIEGSAKTEDGIAIPETQADLENYTSSTSSEGSQAAIERAISVLRGKIVYVHGSTVGSMRTTCTSEGNGMHCVVRKK